MDVFDTSGNYIGPLIEDGLKAPEGLALVDGFLLVADGSKVMKVDLLSGELSVEADLGPGQHRITTVFPDENGNLAVCDFDADRIVLLTPLSTLYGGLDITLDRVRADSFPELVVDLTVKDRKGHPISGLNASNFRVFDGAVSYGPPVLDWSSSEERAMSLVAVIDLSGSSSDIRSLLKGVNDLAGELAADDSLFMVGAGQTPVVETFSRATGEKLIGTLLGKAEGARPVFWDETLRLAATRTGTGTQPEGRRGVYQQAADIRRLRPVRSCGDRPADGKQRYCLLSGVRRSLNEQPGT